MAEVNDDLLARIWSDRMRQSENGKISHGPWVTESGTDYQTQTVSSAAVIDDDLVTCWAEVNWSTGGVPMIVSKFVSVPMGTVVFASDEWRDAM